MAAPQNTSLTGTSQQPPAEPHVQAGHNLGKGAASPGLLQAESGQSEGVIKCFRVIRILCTVIPEADISLGFLLFPVIHHAQLGFFF